MKEVPTLTYLLGKKIQAKKSYQLQEFFELEMCVNLICISSDSKLLKPTDALKITHWYKYSHGNVVSCLHLQTHHDCLVTMSREHKLWSGFNTRMYYEFNCRKKVIHAALQSWLRSQLSVLKSWKSYMCTVVNVSYA